MALQLRIPDDKTITECVRDDHPVPPHYAVVYPVLTVTGMREGVLELTQHWGYETAEDKDEAEAVREGRLDNLLADYGDLGRQLESMCRVVCTDHCCPRCDYSAAFAEEVSQHILDNH